jgi:transcriptional regulator with XRE-family HTH domain
MTGSQLRKARRAQRVPQMAISQATGIDRARISHFENGYLQLTAAELDRVKRALHRRAVQQAARAEAVVSELQR